MFLRQVYDTTLAQAAYVIACQQTGEALVVDPLRDIEPYLRLARDEGFRIVGVTETHIHADYVSGAREVAAATGARIYLSALGGRAWQYAFAERDGATMLHEGDRITLGNVVLDVMHTPGHTPEHIAFRITDTPHAAGPIGVLTGDFVFVGDVGRPDLLERAAAASGTMESSARALYASLARVRALPDHLQLWPGHGAGSACGKALGAVPGTTVGYEKLTNWALQIHDESMFVTSVLEGQPAPPRYFARMKQINRDGPPVTSGSTPAFRELSGAEALARRDEATWFVDVRGAHAFAHAHLPGAVSIPLGRQFATWAGSVLPFDAPIVIVGDADDAAQARRALYLIGIDQVEGFVTPDAAHAAWRATGRALHTLPQLDIELVDTDGTLTIADPADGTTGAIPIVDVRDAKEWKAGHIDGAHHVPLAAIVDDVSLLPRGRFAVHCQSGVRSAVAVSTLHRLGVTGAIDLRGGYTRWRDMTG